MTKIDNLGEFTCNEDFVFEYQTQDEKDKGVAVCNYLWNFVPSDAHKGFYFLEAGISDMYLSLSYPLKDSLSLEYNKFLPRQLWALEAEEESKFSLKSYFTGTKEKLSLKTAISHSLGKDSLMETLQSIFAENHKNSEKSESTNTLKSAKGFDIISMEGGKVPLYQTEGDSEDSVDENVFLELRAYVRKPRDE